MAEPVKDNVREPVLVYPAGRVPVLNGFESDLVGNPLDEQDAEHAIPPFTVLLDPVADYKGSVEYRREMASLCSKRALLDCMEQLS